MICRVCKARPAAPTPLGQPGLRCETCREAMGSSIGLHALRATWQRQAQLALAELGVEDAEISPEPRAPVLRMGRRRLPLEGRGIYVVLVEVPHAAPAAILHVDGRYVAQGTGVTRQDALARLWRVVRPPEAAEHCRIHAKLVASSRA